MNKITKSDVLDFFKSHKLFPISVLDAAILAEWIEELLHKRTMEIFEAYKLGEPLKPVTITELMTSVKEKDPVLFDKFLKAGLESFDNSAQKSVRDYLHVVP